MSYGASWRARGRPSQGPGSLLRPPGALGELRPPGHPPLVPQPPPSSYKTRGPGEQGGGLTGLGASLAAESCIATPRVSAPRAAAWLRPCGSMDLGGALAVRRDFCVRAPRQLTHAHSPPPCTSHHALARSNTCLGQCLGAAAKCCKCCPLCTSCQTTATRKQPRTPALHAASPRVLAYQSTTPP